ncbi:hypothetical protein IV203_004535 [Nitzschia inconspicua]|uniref:ABM domain-containing protein n=1 Tax=Nitzschia inconspicua TaxID=303405 RepID=A0A9K3L4K1_9STRA|nr:hypothetical protein IV203_004535 [Nitzschia inconspicua]
MSTTESTSSTDASSSSNSVFSLFVTLQFSSIDYKHQFLRDIQPLATFVKQHEPETLAYEVLLSDKDDLQVLIVERYLNKDKSFLQVHRSSNEFLTFRPKLQAMVDAGHVTLSGQSYFDANIGFVGRPNA